MFDLDAIDRLYAEWRNPYCPCPDIAQREVMCALANSWPSLAAELRASRIALARAARVEAAAVEMRQGADKPLPWGEWPRLLAAFDAALTEVPQ